MLILRSILFALLMAGWPGVACAQQDHDTGAVTAPIIDYASLRSNKVNLRRGPGQRYPIDWVYQRRGWPVGILVRFDQWRQIRDAEGVVGWVHKSLLSTARTSLVRDPAGLVLRRAPEATARPVAELAPGVVARLDRCAPEWCRLSTAGYSGWAPKSALWGVGRDEEFD